MSLKAECGKHLGRSHYLFALAFNVITKIAASEAHMLQTAGQQAELLCRRGMSIQKSRWESVASSLELIAWREATAHSYQQGALLESSYLNRRVVLPQEPQERVKLIFDQWSKSGLGMNWSSGKEAFYAGRCRLFLAFTCAPPALFTLFMQVWILPTLERRGRRR